jgi:uncharacterized membrane protein YeaQ/YmgE (transglycosylase-associated protein family)
MGILIWTVIGLMFGALANWFLPATNQRPQFLTILVGLAGGIAGGLVGTIFGNVSVTAFSVESLMFAGGGALLLLLGFQLSKSVLYLEQQ